MKLLLHWVLSAIALLFVSRLVPGFFVSGLVAALVTALVIGLLNATVGAFLKILTFPLSVLTLGVFLLVINSVMILMAAKIVPGFNVYGFAPAFWGAVILALLGMVIKIIVKDRVEASLTGKPPVLAQAWQPVRIGRPQSAQVEQRDFSIPWAVRALV